ncbi:MAG: Uma2 family endonuclease [Oculatellaceae cyanobacterium Prado106]|jgi:Uma2 family endonuclease|nr:Uma2 family endonuclease [Oculatellaceae cyanobacterium Prado106]
MSLPLHIEANPQQEQRFLLPGIYDWQAFEALETLLSDSPGLRIAYLDGWIELLTLGEPHELIKSSIAMLLEAYFVAIGLEFIPVGSATRRGKEKGTSFEPDESYYLGERKANPDLAIEVILTSGNLQKLEKYRRFAISEVWLWENNALKVYHLQTEGYIEVPRSQLLPDLDLALLVRCVQIPSRLESMRQFMGAIEA